MKKTLSLILALLLMITLSVPTFAAEFVGSIEAKTAPEIIPMQFEGKSVGAVLLDKDGHETTGISLYNGDAGASGPELAVVSGADKSKASVGEISEKLEKAMEQIRKASNLGKLDSGMKKSLKKAIDRYFGDSDEKVTVSDLVVTDIFDVSIIQDKTQLKALENGQKARFKMKAAFDPDEFFAVIQNTDGNHWRVVEDAEVNDLGELTVTTDHFSVFAIVMRSDAGKAPESHVAFWIIISIVALAVAAGICFLVIYLMKRKNNGQPKTPDANAEDRETNGAVHKKSKDKQQEEDTARELKRKQAKKKTKHKKKKGKKYSNGKKKSQKSKKKANKKKK